MEKKVALVTGGSQGIGLAVAKKLLENNVAVCIFDLDRSKAEENLKISLEAGKYDFIHCDISDSKMVPEAVKSLFDKKKRIDILVHCAGIAGMNSRLEEYPESEWKKIIDINLHGTFYINKAVVPYMRKKGYGRILNISSVAGKEGNPNASAYSASKAAVIALTKSLGKELAHENIAVNAVTPAAAKTRIFDQMSQEHIDYMLSKIPRNRFLSVEEAANMIFWLVSEENSFATGAVFDLSGGRATY